MNISRLRLPELLAAACVSFLVLTASVAPALLVELRPATPVPAVEEHVDASIESGYAQVSYRI